MINSTSHRKSNNFYAKLWTRQAALCFPGQSRWYIYYLCLNSIHHCSARSLHTLYLGYTYSLFIFKKDKQSFLTEDREVWGYKITIICWGYVDHLAAKALLESSHWERIVFSASAKGKIMGEVRVDQKVDGCKIKTMKVGGGCFYREILHHFQWASYILKTQH